MQGKTTPSVPDLPSDVLLRIFELLLDYPQEHLAPTSFLDKHHRKRRPFNALYRQSFVSSIPLVQRAWFPPSQRALHRHVELSTPQAFYSFLTRARQDPTVARHTVTLITICPVESYTCNRWMVSNTAALASNKSKEESLEEANETGNREPSGVESADADAQYYSDVYDEDEPIPSIPDQSLFELLQLLPNLKHLCITSGLIFTLQAEHMSSIPEDLDMLCLHGFSMSGDIFSDLPESLRRLSLDSCNIPTSIPPLKLPELRCLRWIGKVKDSEWEGDAFSSCPKLEYLDITLGFSHESKFIAAYRPLLPRLARLHIDTGTRRVLLQHWFTSYLLGLHHLSIEGNLASEDIAFLPSSLRTFTWTGAGICDLEAVNTLLSLLQNPCGLPNLASIPRIDLDHVIVTMKPTSVSSTLAQEAFRHLSGARGLVQAPNDTDVYSVWKHLATSPLRTGVRIAFSEYSKLRRAAASTPDEEAGGCIVG